VSAPTPTAPVSVSDVKPLMRLREHLRWLSPRGGGGAGRLELSAATCANSSYLEVECGTAVTEELPEQMVGSLDLFLQRLAQSGIGV
jgi:hypothetical protein